MTSGLSSASRPWKELQTFDDGLNEDQSVKEYLAEVDKRMYRFIASTNFYGAVKTGYLEMGLFGTEACIAVEHPTEGMVCHQLTFGEYWLGLGGLTDAGSALPRMRDDRASGGPAVRPGWGDEARPQPLRPSRYDEIVTFYHAIEKNDELCPAGWIGAARNGARSIGKRATATRSMSPRRRALTSSRSGRRAGTRPEPTSGDRGRAMMPFPIFANCSFRPSARPRRPTCTSGRRSSLRPRSS
jgi:hypothetical protein